MSLKDLALATIQGHANSAAPWTMSVNEGGTTLTCCFTTIESLGCAFDELTFESLKLAKADLVQLKNLSQELERKLNYLLEPIITLECDQQNPTVLMRSQLAQQAHPTSTRYYELVLRKGGSVTLCRYEKEKHQTTRQRINCQVTYEVLARLIEDLDPADFTI